MMPVFAEQPDSYCEIREKQVEGYGLISKWDGYLYLCEKDRKRSFMKKKKKPGEFRRFVGYYKPYLGIFSADMFFAFL